jgi:hypothetical protein
MTIWISSHAFKDLAAGRDFYKKQGVGLGAYFIRIILRH